MCNWIVGASKPKDADPRFFMPMFPGKFWRFGVPPLTDEDYCDDLKYSDDKDRMLRNEILKDIDDETII